MDSKSVLRWKWNVLLFTQKGLFFGHYLLWMLDERIWLKLISYFGPVHFKLRFQRKISISTFLCILASIVSISHSTTTDNVLAEMGRACWQLFKGLQITFGLIKKQFCIIYYHKHGIYFICLTKLLILQDVWSLVRGFVYLLIWKDALVSFSSGMKASPSDSSLCLWLPFVSAINDPLWSCNP